jgi:hypothetical protein
MDVFKDSTVSVGDLTRTASSTVVVSIMVEGTRAVGVGLSGRVGDEDRLERDTKVLWRRWLGNGGNGGGEPWLRTAPPPVEEERGFSPRLPIFLEKIEIGRR